MKTAIILIALTVFLMGLAGYSTAPQRDVDIADRTKILLKTCFPGPEFKYKNAAPPCEAFKKYIINEASHD